MLSFTPTPPYFPTTYLERGAAVAFTTPMLHGARVRPGVRCPLEVTVPNPSGGKGQYVLPWGSLQDLCRPTLYDKSLQKAVTLISAVTPSAIRAVTLQVASNGLAGRDVKNAVQSAAARDSDVLVITNYYLLLAMVHEIMPEVKDFGPPTLQSAAALEVAANTAVAEVGPRVGLDSTGVASALESLAAIFTGVGLGPEKTNLARLPQIFARLKRMHEGLGDWIRENGDDNESAAALVLSCAALTLSCAETSLRQTREHATRPVALLADWIKDPDNTAATIARPEWILDGWESICVMWESSTEPRKRRDSISEIASFVPIVPKEAANWVNNFDLEAETASLFRRLVDLNHDWRSGSSVLAATARNENLLASCR